MRRASGNSTDADAAFDAVVVGAGPNGLAAAITLAEAGRSVLVLEAESSPGGGARTAELTLPGYLHDVCSAFHPLAAGSQFFEATGLSTHGLELVQPDVPYAHPLDEGRAGVAYRSLDETAARLGIDDKAWNRSVGWLAQRWDTLGPDILGPLLKVPNHPLSMAAFGLRGAGPASLLAKAFQTDEAKALISGTAAHSFLRLNQPFTAGAALVLAALGHVAGWPVVRGGSGRLSSAMVSKLTELGGEVVCDYVVRSLADIPPSKVVLFDLAPSQMIDILGDELPASYVRRLSRFKRGPGVFKLDYALSEPIPWTNSEVRKAGTVHVGGTFEQIARSESEVLAGRHPAYPFVLVGQQSVVDSSRTPDSGHTLWAYCHVPNGSTKDMSNRIEDQIERFAPGFRDTIVAKHQADTAWYQAHNRTLLGGDIGGGTNSRGQLLARPLWSISPYRTPNTRFFICSSSTPPGGGVHGLSGLHAAMDALSSSLKETKILEI